MIYRMTAVFIITALASLLCLGTFAAAPSDWAKESYTKASSLDLAVEEQKTTGDATRLDFCRLAYGTLETLRTVPSAASCPFADTDEQSVAVLYALGVVRGRDETHFCPGDSITREEAAVLLWRMLNAAGVENVAEERTFADMDEVSDWAKTAVSSIPSSLMQGVGADRFAPCEPYTYEQCVTTLMRFHDITAANTPDAPQSGFADTLYASMPADADFVLSPLSAKLSLALAANGARGETEKELLSLLGTDSVGAFNEYAASLLADYAAAKEVTLHAANGAYINTDRTDLRFAPAFAENVGQFYAADTSLVGNADAAGVINGFAAEHTDGHITEVIDGPDFDIALIDALFFEGKWAYENDLSEGVIAGAPFYTRNGTQKQMSFIKKRDEFRYYADASDGVRGVRLGYESAQNEANIAMYLFISDGSVTPRGTRVTNIEDRIKNGPFEYTDVRLSLPRFDVTNRVAVNEAVPAVDALIVFDSEKADLTAMTDGGRPFIGRMDQTAFIHVDEFGTSAGAVTVEYTLGAPMYQKKPVEMTFDHPFTFAIYDETHGEVLFIGEYAFGDAETTVPDRYMSETMYKAMPTDRNYMFSPLSAKAALGLAAAGAEGETKEELLDFIRTDEDELEWTIDDILGDYGAENPIMQLSMANGIFYNISHTDQRFSPAYVKKAADLYDAAAAEVTDDNAVQTVNDFAAEHTNGRITQVVYSPDDFEVLLMNALYFKGEWQTPFMKQATCKEPFTDRDGKQTETDFMHVTDRFAYASEDGVQIVELPYKSSDYIETDDGYTRVNAPAEVSMYLLMSDERVMNCEERIRTAPLTGRRIRLSMPKFRMRNSLDLSSIPSLASLRAFDKDRAEFAPMVTEDEMWLDFVKQETYIEVDETGTEAAAVTYGGKAGATAVEQPPLEVTFDHPFTFVIFDKTHDEVLFMGEYAYVS